MNDVRIAQVLEFWFGQGVDSFQNSKLWFDKNEQFDQDIAKRFLPSSN